MATKKQHAEIQADYYYMVNEYGEPDDLTGGFVLDDHCFKLLRTPTVTAAYNLYKRLIEYGFQHSYYIWSSEGPTGNTEYTDIHNDLTAKRIHDDHC
jgi:hypothetical protein